MGGTILLADDSITIQKVVELTFASTEHEVVAVNGGGELLDRLSELDPDVVLCDVVMPDMNGYEVCEHIKSDPATLHIPVVLLTGTFEPFDRDRAMAVGCDGIVTKPFESRELVSVVGDLMERSFAARQLAEREGATSADEAADVPSLDFSRAGFEEMTPPEETDSAAADDGIELSDSDAGSPFGTGVGAPVIPPVGGAEATAADIGRDEPWIFGGGQAAREAPEAPDQGEASPFTSPPEEAGPEAETVEASGGVAADAGSRGTEAEPADEAGGTAQQDEVEEAVPEGEMAGGETGSEDEEAAASVEDMTPPAGAPEEIPAPVVAGERGHELSDEDVERIATRVVELSRPLLERIAWEVIPDMAEMLVRQRIRELETEVGEES